jgi:hypothetical protein
MSELPGTQGKTLPDAWDYKGRPAERSKTGGWTAAAMILGLTSIICIHLPCSSTILLIHYSFFNIYRWRGNGKVNNAGYCRQSGDLFDCYYAFGKCYLCQHGHQLPWHLFHALFTRWLYSRHLSWQVQLILKIQ